MLTREEIAHEFNVHVNTIDKWRKLGMPVIQVGRYIRFEVEDVKAWLKGEK